jgi:hypothetical protein
MNNEQKTLTDKEILDLAEELNLKDYYGSELELSGADGEKMFFKEKKINNKRLLEILKPFVLAVLRKAQ